jgi:hypothetical protein
MNIPIETDQFLSKKRARKDSRKRKILRKKQLISSQNKNKVNNLFGNQSKLITLIAKDYKGEEIKHKGYLKLSTSEIFSVIENPTSVIGGLGQFAKSIRKFRPKSIELDYSKLTKYDLAASSLLDLIAVELKKEAKQYRRKIKWRGAYPKDPNIKRFIKALGIIKHLELKHEYPKADEAADLRIFDVRNRHYYKNNNPAKADKKTKVITDFADHINACLNDINKELTPEARHSLCEYTGEIIDNAEEHAEMLDWTVQGYLDNSCEILICEIAIFNFGKTISQTLSDLDKSSYTWKQIAPYLEMHKERRFFGPSWSENDLLTLIALQGHVSSKNYSTNDTRGNGSIDLIEFFQKIHAECATDSPIKATMAILSGSTHILFDGTYKLSSEDNTPMRIAFNKDNNLYAPPDINYVKGLKGVHFPGTIISIRFPLNVTNISKVENQK